ncbi:MAG TPA: aminotransferase class III-fold pyridoxal phosphate-dependent enzyme, partial [Steroidobacter sp.]|nr:aminotransferase class III-fold pyridoxal phosphate-dependent enzyme [Steroidobacter sp.]
AENLVANAADMGARLRDHLLTLQRTCPIMGDVRGRGLMIGVEIVDPNGRLDVLGHPPQDGRMASAIQRECLKGGLILELGGRHGSVVRFLPPLIVNAAQIDRIARIFGKAVRAAVSAG